MAENKSESDQEVKASVTVKEADERAKKIPLDEKQQELLKKQVENEYLDSKRFLKPKIDEWLKRLKLYNNQKRDKTAVGDPLIFTVMNSLLASLYDDRMTVIWEGRERGDLEMEEHLNVLSEYDYDSMDKAALDLDWLWDVLFFSYGLVNMTEFDRSQGRKLPVPELIDPASFLYDRKASSVDGNTRGIGGMRFCGREILLTKNQMDAQGVFSDIDLVKETTTKDDLTQEAARMRQEALGGEGESAVSRLDFKGNNYFRLVEWRTWFEGKRVLTTFANELGDLVRYQPLEDKSWQLVDKTIWRMSHQFQGVSVPDLVEDKQRKRSVISNLAVKVLQSDLYPMYVYNSDMTGNKADFSFGFNKFIPVSGPVNQAVAPIHKVSPNMQLYDWAMNLLDTASQRATATPELQQGVISKEARTLGELNLVAQKVDTRYSLAVKNLMTGEKKFWRQWYRLYKKHFKSGIDKKVLRLSGVMSGEFRELTRDNIIMKEDPDVKIESRLLSEAKKMKQLARTMEVLNMAANDPTANMRFGVKMVASLSGMERDEIDVLFPPTLDEMMAREQNDALDENKQVPVLPQDNHAVHLEIHAEAADTDATYAHIETHKQAMLLQRDNPELFPGTEQQQPAQQAGLPAPDQQGGQQGISVGQERPAPRPSQVAEREVAMNQ